jgi:hypothetical protein
VIGDRETEDSRIEIRHFGKVSDYDAEMAEFDTVVTHDVPPNDATSARPQEYDHH